MPNRVCIFGTPRSGSQYIAELIAKSISVATLSECVDIGEPFTIDQLHLPILENNKKIILQELHDTISIKERVDNILSAILESDITQPLVIKVFPYDYIIPFLDKIISTLTSCGFEIVIVKRNNKENQLISLGVAHTINAWNSNYNNAILNSKITINSDILGKIFWLHLLLLSFDNILKIFNLQYSPVIYYETAATDLYNVLKIPIRIRDVQIQKQITSDPYEFITNADEVRQFIGRLL